MKNNLQSRFGHGLCSFIGLFYFHPLWKWVNFKILKCNFPTSSYFFAWWLKCPVFLQQSVFHLWKLQKENCLLSLLPLLIHFSGRLTQFIKLYVIFQVSCTAFFLKKQITSIYIPDLSTACFDTFLYVLPITDSQYNHSSLSSTNIKFIF